MWPCPLSLRTKAHQSASSQASELQQQRLPGTVTCTCPRVPGFFALAARKCDLSESPWTESSSNTQTQPAARSARYFRGKRKRRTARRLPEPAVHLHSRAAPLQHTGLLPPPSPGALSSAQSHTVPQRPLHSRDGPHSVWSSAVPLLKRQEGPQPLLSPHPIATHSFCPVAPAARPRTAGRAPLWQHTGLSTGASPLPSPQHALPHALPRHLAEPPRGCAASSTALHSRTCPDGSARGRRDGSVPVPGKDERFRCCRGERCRGKGQVWDSPGPGGGQDPVPVKKSRCRYPRANADDGQGRSGPEPVLEMSGRTRSWSQYGVGIASAGLRLSAFQPPVSEHPQDRAGPRSAPPSSAPGPVLHGSFGSAAPGAVGKGAGGENGDHQLRVRPEAGPGAAAG